MQLGCYLLMFQFLLLSHFLYSSKEIGIDPVQIRDPSVRNRTIPVLRSIERGNIASSFRNYSIPDPDQIGIGDGYISSWFIETEFTLSGTEEAIRDNQHNGGSKKQIHLLILTCSLEIEKRGALSYFLFPH